MFSEDHVALSYHATSPYHEIAPHGPADRIEPMVPHEDPGADCCGFIIAELRGTEADLVCNECGAVVATVPADRIDAAMRAIAPNAICSARCLHCGAVNTFPGFTSIDAFICAQCGEGVAVSLPVQ